MGSSVNASASFCRDDALVSLAGRKSGFGASCGCTVCGGESFGRGAIDDGCDGEYLLWFA